MTVKDRVFRRVLRIGRPAAEVFRWHERPGAFQRLLPPWERIELLEQSGGIRDGARVVLRLQRGPVRVRWEVEHRDYVRDRQFRDVQHAGPFAKWEHLHRFEPAGTRACDLIDEIHYRLPLRPVGELGAGLARRQLERMFMYRHDITQADLDHPLPAPPARVLISGASGLVGQALQARFTTSGCEVVRLVRRTAKAADEVAWDPARGELDLNGTAPCEAVVHLAGANLGEGRWTAERKREILDSRVEGTRTLVRALTTAQWRPRVLVSASAIGFYGNRGEDVLTEAAGPGRGFLADVCRRWEAELEPAVAAGIRTVAVRTGVVLSAGGGALAKMLPVFRLGTGGRLGDGRQWMSWISLDDLVEVIGRACGEPAWQGPVNATAPQPVRNAEFTATLARVLARPAPMAVPALALRLAVGEMADEALLASARVVPEKLQAAGFGFRHPELEAALRHTLGRQEERA